MGWETASTFCKERGAELVLPKNSDEESAVIKLFHDATGADEGSFWIDVRSTAYSTNYTQSNGGELVYTNWYKNQPESSIGWARIKYRISDGKFGWFDATGGSTSSICEMSKFLL